MEISETGAVTLCKLASNVNEIVRCDYTFVDLMSTTLNLSIAFEKY